jgi:hypothetical protein
VIKPISSLSAAEAAKITNGPLSRAHAWVESVPEFETPFETIAVSEISEANVDGGVAQGAEAETQTEADATDDNDDDDADGVINVNAVGCGTLSSTPTPRSMVRQRNTFPNPSVTWMNVMK